MAFSKYLNFSNLKYDYNMSSHGQEWPKLIFQGYLISQSGDAQCTLHSAKEGDKTMTLKKVNNHEKQCSLPHWMLQHHHTFRNLNGSIIYHFNTLGTSLTIKQSSLDKKLKCNTIEEETGNFTKIIMQVNFEWWDIWINVIVSGRTFATIGIFNKFWGNKHN